MNAFPFFLSPIVFPLTSVAVIKSVLLLQPHNQLSSCNNFTIILICIKKLTSTDNETSKKKAFPKKIRRTWKTTKIKTRFIGPIKFDGKGLSIATGTGIL